MSLRRARALPLLLCVPLAAEAAAFSLGLEARSGPGNAGAPETRVHLIVPAFDAGTTPGEMGLLLMIFHGEDAVASARWRARPTPGTACRPALGETRVFRLAPGSYRARVRAEPADGEPVEQEFAIRVPEIDAKGLVLSELTLGCCPEGDSPPDTLLPHGTAPFGDRARPCVYFRAADTRPDLPDTAYVIRVRLRDETREAFRETWRLPRRGTPADTVWSPGAPLPAGRYRFDVEARIGTLHAERTVPFTVVGERVGREPWELRILLAYVATPEELVEVDEAPDESLEALWRRFWERRDPLPETPDNEALLRFEGRVEEASRRFGVMEPGWQSDQGRIFIRLGEPDRVETMYADAFRPAGEIWYYYARHATYVFQDVDGFGRLRLVGGR